MVKKTGQLPPVPKGLPDDARHATANALHSAALRLLRRVRAVDVQMDLDGPRASALSVLVFAGPMPIGRLATMEQVTAPAITKTVTALEADGLAVRKRSDVDRRVVLVEATRKGHALLEKGRAARVRALAALLDQTSEADQRLLHRAATILAGLL